jgi:hypothetical protein
VVQGPFWFDAQYIENRVGLRCAGFNLYLH